MRVPSNPRVLLAPVLLLSAMGCAGLPADHGIDDTRRLVSERRAIEPAAPGADTRRLVADLLAQPLTADAAVRIALLNNPRLQAEYARLGLAAAEVYDAGRLSNPGLGVSVLASSEAGAANAVTFGLAQSFTDLLLLPARSRLARAEFERAKLEAGAAILDLAAEVEMAYFELVGAQQVLAMREAVHTAAGAAAELAQRFHDAGNINALELVMEQSAATQARLDVAQARSDALTARSALNRLLGLRAGDGRWSVSDRLPAVLEADDDFDALFDLAQRSRLDLAAKQAEVDALADSLGVTRRFRYLGAVELGYELEKETDGARLSGPHLSLELPIFNQGRGKVTRAESALAQAEAELHAMALDVGHAVHLAHAQVGAARERAGQYRSELIPQREAIVARTQEEVNYMLEGQFQLLAVKQQEYDAYQGYLEAVRDYWLARVRLSHAAGSRLPSAARAGTAVTPMVGPPILQEPDDAMDHSGHDMHHGDH